VEGRLPTSPPGCVSSPEGACSSRCCRRAMRACRRLNRSNQSCHSSWTTAHSLRSSSTSCRRARIRLISLKTENMIKVRGRRSNVSGAIERVSQRRPRSPPGLPTLLLNTHRVKSKNLAKVSRIQGIVPSEGGHTAGRGYHLRQQSPLKLASHR